MVFHGLAAGDHDVARAIFGPRPRSLSGGHRPTVRIYNAAQAIVTENRGAQTRLRPEIEYPDVPDCYRAILRTLHRIIITDATAVAVNLERVLATFHRMEFHEHEQVIAILAHGLAELTHRTSPDLLAEFDLDRPWPWASAYHRWLHRRNRSTRYRDLSKHSALLHRWVHDLEEPGWWHDQAHTKSFLAFLQHVAANCSLADSGDRRGRPTRPDDMALRFGRALLCPDHTRAGAPIRGAGGVSACGRWQRSAATCPGRDASPALLPIRDMGAWPR